MARDIITVCLPPTAPADVPDALAAAMAPFWNDAEIAPGDDWQGEWEWWHIFGGHDAQALAVRPSCEDDPRLVRNPLWSDGSLRPPLPPGRCDGGPRGLLDLDLDRSPVAGAAGADWDGWTAFSAGFEPALSEAAITEQSSDGWAGRAAFFEQPVIRAVAALANDPQAPQWATKAQDPVAHYSGSREPYVRRFASRAVTTNVLLTLDGRWLDGTRNSNAPST